MTGAVTITLDTTAPLVTWGGVSGTTAGELFVIGYSLDEPDSVSASVQLADGRMVSANLFADRIEALVPADTPQGNALVSLEVLDDVGNAATRTTFVLLAGTAIPAPPPNASGLPARARGQKRPADSKHKQDQTKSVQTKTAVQTYQSRARIICWDSITTGSRTSNPVLHTRNTDVSRVRQSPKTAISSSLGTTSKVGLNTSSDRRRRDDDALVALLLVD